MSDPQCLGIAPHPLSLAIEPLFSVVISPASST
jgi:hypothetical protein